MPPPTYPSGPEPIARPFYQDHSAAASDIEPRAASCTVKWDVPRHIFGDTRPLFCGRCMRRTKWLNKMARRVFGTSSAIGHRSLRLCQAHS